MYRHFRTIAEAVDLPLLLYNVPSRTVADLANDTVLRLAEMPGIVGMKDATSDLVRLVDLRNRLPAGARVRAVLGQRRHGAAVHAARRRRRRSR